MRAKPGNVNYSCFSDSVQDGWTAKDSCCETTVSPDPCCDFNTAETRIDDLKINPAN